MKKNEQRVDALRTLQLKTEAECENLINLSRLTEIFYQYPIDNYSP